MTRKGTAMTAMLAATIAATGVQAQTAPTQPVKVGIIDTTVGKLMMGYKGVDVESRVFVGEGREAGTWQAVPGYTHGEVVASSFVEQSRLIDKKAPIKVYSANAFYQYGPRNPNGNKSMSLDFEGAENALQWFHDNGVRTVVAAFYTQDSPAMRSFMKKAENLNIVLFAGTNNDKTKVVPFPARDPYSIAVTGNNANLDFADNPSMSRWTAFKMNGDIPTNSTDPTEENGSSFAVAKAAAFGAHILRNAPDALRDEVVTVLRTASGYKSANRVADLDGGDAIRRFRSASMSISFAARAKGPESGNALRQTAMLSPATAPGR